MTPPKSKITPRRAIGYVRISKDRPDETSTETQEERVRAYCVAHGWPVVEIVTEPGRSAYKSTRTSRPGFRRVMGLVSSGAADTVVVWKIDRACRNTEDTLALVRELDGYGGRFVSVTEGFDSATPTGKMTMTVLAALAELESATKSERVKEWHDHRRSMGRTPVGPRPFGYRRERNRLLIDKSEAAVIRRMAKQLLAGKSLRSITHDLQAAGVVGTNGKPISYSAIRHVLLSPTTAALRETATGVHLRSDDWKPILDEQTWDAVRALLTDPSRRTGPGNARRWLLAGIAVCGRCEGGPGMTVKGHVRGPRYSCQVCHLSIEAARVDEIVVSDLLALLDPRTWRRLRRGQSTVDDTVGFEQAMTELTARFVAGDIDADELAALADALRRQQEAAATPTVTLPDVADLSKAWGKLSLEQRRLVISTATESLTILPGVRGSHRFDEKRIVWTPVV